MFAVGSSLWSTVFDRCVSRLATATHCCRPQQENWSHPLSLREALNPMWTVLVYVSLVSLLWVVPKGVHPLQIRHTTSTVLQSALPYWRVGRQTALLLPKSKEAMIYWTVKARNEAPEQLRWRLKFHRILDYWIDLRIYSFRREFYVNSFHWRESSLRMCWILLWSVVSGMSWVTRVVPNRYQKICHLFVWPQIKH